MNELFKKNWRALAILLIITFLISILYYYFDVCRVIFNSIASILAIPNLIVSFIVLKVIDIKPENLDSYYRLRMMKDNENKENKKKAKKAFADNLNSTKELCKKYSNFYSNKKNKRGIANSSINQCVEGQEKLREFFEETKEYIFADFLPKIKNLGELETIDNVNVSLVNLSDKDSLSEKLNKIKEELFRKEELSEDDENLLDKLFSDKGLMQKYLNTCNHAYKEIEEEKDNEI